MPRSGLASATPNGAHRVLSYAQVVERGREYFLREGTINLDALAAEIPVSRATMYRLVAGRDQVLGDVVWSLADDILESLTESVTSTGVDAIVEITIRFYKTVLAAKPFRHFLETEPDAAARVLFTPAPRVHERAVKAQARVFRIVQERDGVDLPEDLEGLAYLYVRIAESLLYADMLIGRTPDLQLIERAARALLSR